LILEKQEQEPGMSDLTARLNAVFARLRAEQEARLGPASPDPGDLARVLALPLAQLDRVLRIRVPWLRGSLWFVPDAPAVAPLLAKGVARGRIWTELGDLLRLPSLTTAQVRTVALAKLAFDGDVVAVRAASPARPSSGQPEPLR
jgi:hypothetical protein